MKAYKDDKSSNSVKLKIQSSKDKQLAIILKAKIEKDDTAVMRINTSNKDEIETIFRIFKCNDIKVDRNTYNYLNDILIEARRKESLEKEKKESINNKKIEKANIIKKSLEDKNIDLFDNYKGLSDCLLPHQKAGALIASIFDKYAFYYDTGTGKTVLALEVIAQNEKAYDISFLIICPKTIIKTAWLEDRNKFYPQLKILPLSKNITIDDYKKIYRQWNRVDEELAIEEKFIDGDVWEKGSEKDRINKVLKRLLPRTKHYIVNPETFKNNIKFYKELKVNGLIVDESAMLKNYHSKTSSIIRQYSSNLNNVYLLSGKPAPNNTLEYFPQLKTIDPNFFSMSYEKYRDKYYEQGPFSYGFEFKSEQCEREVTKLISERSIFLSKDDCIVLPEKTYQIRKIILPSEIKEKYDSMLYRYYVEITESENEEKNIYVVNKLASLMKLRQITSGFVIDDGKELFLHDEKEKELKNILNEIGDHQVIIWCQFGYEVRKIYSIISEMNRTAVTAYGGTKNVDESIKSFKKGDARYIIAHPRTLQYGVTLTNCTYSIYYSMSYSHEQYYQSHDRIYRKGQKNICTYIFLQAEDTIDERVYFAVQNKKTNAELFEMLIKDAKKVKQKNSGKKAFKE